MARVSGQQDHGGQLALLGQVIRQKRLKLGLSQEALADASGIDRSHMGKIERGERNVTALNLLRIAKALGVSLGAIVSEAGL